MSKLTAYTIEVYRKDLRKASGRRLVETKDFEPVTRDYILVACEQLEKQGYIVDLHETFVTRQNLMGGKEFTERYDTPSFCSPASESYWSM